MQDRLGNHNFSANYEFTGSKIYIVPVNLPPADWHADSRWNFTLYVEGQRATFLFILSRVMIKSAAKLQRVHETYSTKHM